MDWEIRTLGIRPGTRVSQLTTPTHDPFLRDVWVPLCAGGTVCAPDDRETVLDARALAAWVDGVDRRRGTARVAYPLEIFEPENLAGVLSIVAGNTAPRRLPSIDASRIKSSCGLDISATVSVAAGSGTVACWIERASVSNAHCQASPWL